jgi:transcriptional regulator with XRE-family HTH domain
MKNRFKRKRLKLKIVEHFGTQDHFAYVSGIDSALLSKYINAHRDPSSNHLKLMAELLETNETELIKKYPVL